MNKFFAAFIITYERPDILSETIKTIFLQTQLPEKLLIVDNSISDKTKTYFDSVLSLDQRISYYRVGYNSGASGGAYHGLKILADSGYEYIQWLDDDDPPLYHNANEELLKLFELDKRIGVVGQVGSKYSKISGRLSRFSDLELDGPGALLVDYVGGGQLMIIKLEVIKKGCLPERDLFFGFEDLSFCLKVKSMGYLIGVPRSLFLKMRVHFNRIGKVKNVSGPSWRDYYSARSLTYISLYEQHNIFPLFFLFGKAIAGVFVRSTYRWLPLKGFLDGLVRKKGMVVSPVKK